MHKKRFGKYGKFVERERKIPIGMKKEHVGQQKQGVKERTVAEMVGHRMGADTYPPVHADGRRGRYVREL